MRYLLEHRVVSAGMLSQNLLALFVESKDWVRCAYPFVYTMMLSPSRSSLRSAESR